MSSIDLYTAHPDHYDQLQHLRSDYVGAQQAFVGYAVKYLNGVKDAAIVDFCSGVGKDSKLICDRIPIDTVRLVDINEDFLKIASETGINARNVIPIHSDILKADVGNNSDAVVSMFAYHHVRDSDKAVYIEKVRDALKLGGILFVGEIYSPDRETTLRYYEHLIRSIPTASKNKELRTFLLQTAQSDDFEFKVSRKFAHDQLTAAGFELLESKKIWPVDDSFSPDVGTFVEVWKMK
jgi:ubiquinone/menaquinone biosynthesis C-methylase UbiE